MITKTPALLPALQRRRLAVDPPTSTKEPAPNVTPERPIAGVASLGSGFGDRVPTVSPGPDW